MRDVALDGTTGDLALAAGAARLTAPGAEATAQRLQIRLGLWRGEYPLDQNQGIPYATLLSQKGAAADLLEPTLRTAASTSPGVDALLSFALTTDPVTRRATGSLTARTLSGEPISLAAFQVGA